jgi:hypothetical protein
MRLTPVVRAICWLALVGACSSSSSKSAEDAGDNGEDGLVVNSRCPSLVPADGSSCAGAASCLYGTPCEEINALCTGNNWVIRPVVPADGGNCPASAPDDGAYCLACMVAAKCPYNPACDVDGGPNVTATCVPAGSGNTWKVTADPCEPEDAGQDQGVAEAKAEDAGSDADANEANDASDAGNVDGAEAAN